MKKYLLFTILNIVITSIIVISANASPVAALVTPTPETICFRPKSGQKFTMFGSTYWNFHIVGRPYAKLTMSGKNAALVVCDEADPPLAPSYLWKLFPNAGC